MEIEGKENKGKNKKEKEKQNESQIAMEEFVDEIEQDRDMRKNFLLFKNEDVHPEEVQLEDEMVQLKELVQELQVTQKDEKLD